MKNLLKKFKDMNFVQGLCFIFGALCIAFAGLFFCLYADLKIKCTAGWLFFLVLFSMGSAIASALIEGSKGKKKLFFIIKGLSVLLAIGFVIFMFVFKGSSVYTGAIDKAIKASNSIKPIVATWTITLVFGFLGLLGVGANFTLDLIFGVEE